MWFRGRTVVAMMVLTAIAASVATYSFFELSDWSLKPSGSDASSENEGLNQDELDKLNKAFNLIEQRFIVPMDRNKLLDGALQGMVESLSDPYSVYKSEEEAEEFNDAIHGAFTGIGAELRVDNGEIVVEAPIRGSPAERAGLQPLDVLLSVNGESLKGVTLSEAVAKIRGPKGTKAKLKVRRSGVTEPLDLELVRDRIGLKTVDAEISPDGIGHLIINQFDDETAGQVAIELQRLRTNGMKALVIDVRDNPGGLLKTVIDVADQLVEKGKPIVQSEYKDGERIVDVAKNGVMDNAIPLVVLINEGSASAAEILAGALKQSADAVLVGITTYGKGTVQVPFNEELGDKSLIKLTVNKWLLPDGTWIDQKGIEPDIEVAQPDYFQAYRLPRDYILKFDTSGEAVENLQNILEGVGFPADRTDGYFSQETKKALERFQQQQALPVSGEVDPKTAQRLEDILQENLQKPEVDTQWQAALSKAREMMQAR